MDNFVFKRVKCLDIINESLKDNGNLESQLAQFDGDMALLTGELRLLMTDFSSLVELTIKPSVEHTSKVASELA